MFIKKINFKKEYFVYIFFIFCCILRIIFGEFISVSAVVDAGVDDYLMLLYSDFSHFINKNPYSLVKNMSYPVFLFLVDKIGIRYSIFISLYWCLTALFVFFAISKITKNNFIRVLSYIYVLFMPIGYNVSVGMRVYRNSIIVPSVLITISIAALLFMDIKNKILDKKFIFKLVLLGIFFTFTYYIKEDGLWIYCCLIFFILFSIVYYLFCTKNIKRDIKILFILVPIILFYLLTFCYKRVNKHYFGVYEINTRTEGELGKFVNNIYKIDSNDKSIICWAPYDSIEKAYNASETFKSNKNLFESIVSTESYDLKGDIKENPIRGDFLSWVLRFELVKNSMWTSEVEVSELFKKINNELDLAFKNGTLKRSKKLQIISSSGGYSIDEIKKLFPIISDSFKSVIFFDGFRHQILNKRMMMSLNDKSVYDEALDLFSKKLNMNEIKNENFDNSNEKVMKVLKFLYIIYGILNTILFINFIFVTIFNIYVFIKNKFKLNENKNLILTISNIIFFVIILVYTFAISWFIYFLCDIEKYNFNYIIFYNLASHSFFTFIYLFSLIILIDIINKIKKFTNIFNNVI